jgi:type I restriction enzyme S subunit
MTEIGEIPDDWEIKTLDEITSQFISGGTPSTSNPDYWNGEIPWMRSAWINKRFVDAGEKYISEKGLKNSATNVVPCGSLLVATRVCIGNVALNNIDIAISQDLTGIVIRKEKAAPEYVYWALKNLENRIKSLVQGSTIGGVLREDLRKLRIPIPLSVLEQQKIALVVSTVDDAILKTDEIIAKTQQLKKGLMQQLLTRGIGYTKFKQSEIGMIPEEWDLVRLGQIATIRYGLGQPPHQDENGIPMIRATNIEGGQILDEGMLRIKRSAIPLSRDPFLKSGDIIIVRSGVYTGDIGLVTSKFEGAVAGYDLIVSPSEKADSVFLAHYLLSSRVQAHFFQLKFRAAQSHLNAQQVSDTPIALPSCAEQKRIASILSGVEEKHDKENRRKVGLEQMKKGLMQVLLTGKVRVKVG